MTGLTRAHLKDEDLKLDSVDVYNIPKANEAAAGAGRASKKSELAFASYPMLPITLHPNMDNPVMGPPRPPITFDIKADTSGKDFVSVLGEPDRKGGGAGPSSGSIGIWCEWSQKAGILVEFGGEEARGPQAWEKGKDSIWKVMTIFQPGSASC